MRKVCIFVIGKILTATDNGFIHPDLAPIHDLGQNPYVYPISSAHVETANSLPDYLRNGFICMTLSHRINRAGPEARNYVLIENYYRCRGDVIRSLNEEISEEHRRKSDVVLAGMMGLLLADVSRTSRNKNPSAILNCIFCRRSKAHLTIGNIT